MADGFHIAMFACAGLAAAGGILAWLTISSEVLEAEPEPGGDAPDAILPTTSPVAWPERRCDRDARPHAARS